MAIWQNTNLVLALRGVQLFFGIVVLGLQAYVVNQANYSYQYYDGFGYSYISGRSLDQTNFLLFCGIWTLLVGVYMIMTLRFLKESVVAHPYAIATVDGITMIFWFAGFIAQAAPTSYYNGDGTINLCIGCGVVIAAIVLGAFEWLLFLATFILDILQIVSTRRQSRTTATMATTEETTAHPAEPKPQTPELGTAHDGV